LIQRLAGRVTEGQVPEGEKYKKKENN
jgi:hypothetical protein